MLFQFKHTRCSYFIFFTWFRQWIILLTFKSISFIIQQESFPSHCIYSCQTQFPIFFLQLLFFPLPLHLTCHSWSYKPLHSTSLYSPFLQICQILAHFPGIVLALPARLRTSKPSLRLILSWSAIYVCCAPHPTTIFPSPRTPPLIFPYIAFSFILSQSPSPLSKSVKRAAQLRHSGKTVSIQWVFLRRTDTRR